MLKVSLSETIGKEKSRQVKKLIFYFGAGALGYILVACAWLAYSLVVWIRKENPLDAPAWVYFTLLYSPVIVVIVMRFAYKYAHNKEQARENQQLANSFLDIALGRKEFIDEMQSNVIKDSGNYRDDLAGGYSREDLERAMRGKITLEDFEAKG